MSNDTRRNLWAVFLLAAAVRALVLIPLWQHPERACTPDSRGYERIAVNILTQRVISLSAQEPYELSALRTPVYPLVIAAVYRTGLDARGVLALQVLLGAGTCALAYLLAFTLIKRRRAAVLCAFICCFEPASVFMSGYLLSESLFTFLVVAACAATFWSLLRSDRALFTASFALMGVAALCRPAFLYFPFLIAVLLCALRLPFGKRWIAAGLVAYGLTLSPWLCRNHAAFGEWVFTSIQDDVLFSYAHNVRSIVKGTPLAYERVRAYAECTQGIPAGTNEVLRKRLIRPCGMRYLKEHPVEFATVFAKSLVDMMLPRVDTAGLLLTGRHTSFDLKNLVFPESVKAHPRAAAYLGGALLFLLAAYALALRGAVRLVRRAPAAGLVAIAFIVYYALLGGITFQERYRAVIVPWIALCAAAAWAGKEGRAGA